MKTKAGQASPAGGCSAAAVVGQQTGTEAAGDYAAAGLEQGSSQTGRPSCSSSLHGLCQQQLWPTAFVHDLYGLWHVGLPTACNKTCSAEVCDCGVCADVLQQAVGMAAKPQYFDLDKGAHRLLAQHFRAFRHGRDGKLPWVRYESIAMKPIQKVTRCYGAPDKHHLPTTRCATCRDTCSVLTICTHSLSGSGLHNGPAQEAQHSPANDSH